ncbi:Major Facilitator Superfamily protein [Pelagimonas phthalicica]|uniref:Major Facilitator Superfamily protein n=1 Tax=Pelagimonas phthalicica TaxID=1037362 RepID=A0A238J7X6_9RHOB|nr:MFS transporter [Pelagimonas phthalicica]TDS94704.1 putative MFS family arabinose efflux permease [Pelagimonas phthalicica]SMX26768.1 Major Facilitator Superfamily protein [Pelagimonas phthalicica]
MTIPLPKPLLVLLLWFAGLGAAAQFAKIAVPFDQLQAAYPGIGAQVGWLLSLVSLVGVFLGIVAGNLVARFGAKRLLLLSLALGGALSLLQSGLPRIELMLISRVIEGLSHLIIVVAAPTLIAQLTAPRFMGLAMGLWSSFFGVSFAITAWGVIPMLGEQVLPPLFLGHGVLLLGLSGLVLLFVPTVIQHDNTAPAPQGFVASHITAFRSPRISAPAAGWLFYTLTFVSLVAILPEKLPLEVKELAVGAMPLISVIGSLAIVPILLRRFSAVQIIIAGMGAAALLVIATLAIPFGLASALTLFAVLGLIQGGSFASVPALNSDVQDRALSYGLMAQAGNTGNLLGTPLLLWAGDIGGEAGFFASTAAIYALGALAHLWLARQRRAIPN